MRHAFRQNAAKVRTCRHAENHKLITAKAGEKILLSETRLKPGRDRPDEMVTGLMAKRVVDVLEAIDIEIGGDSAAAAPLDTI